MKGLTKRQMFDNIIRKWGFEHDFTIAFALLMDDKKINERILGRFYRDLMDL